MDVKVFCKLESTLSKAKPFALSLHYIIINPSWHLRGNTQENSQIEPHSFSRKGCQTTQTGIERQAGKEVSVSSNEMEEAEAKKQK